MIRVSVILVGLVVASAAWASNLDDANSKCMTHVHLVKDGPISRMVFDAGYDACTSVVVARWRHDAAAVAHDGRWRPAPAPIDTYTEAPEETAAVNTILGKPTDTSSVH